MHSLWLFKVIVLIKTAFSLTFLLGECFDTIDIVSKFVSFEYRIHLDCNYSLLQPSSLRIHNYFIVSSKIA